jgi:hypothetical protein
MTFEEDQEVLVRYPLSAEAERGDRSEWPWLDGVIVQACGDAEWQVVVIDERLAAQFQGQTVYPVCFRDSTELRPRDEPQQDGQTKTTSS